MCGLIPWQGYVDSLHGAACYFTEVGDSLVFDSDLRNLHQDGEL